jgi:hypothetical protein
MSLEYIVAGLRCYHQGKFEYHYRRMWRYNFMAKFPTKDSHFNMNAAAGYYFIPQNAS